ncbi:hypothetical protein ZIOFF_040435 [Zingiber officinale]|uniref:Uncharacterized protein n=1 Tax=Zingiber officinale TaxID=94328 RepID=A0A8J5GCI6_ZINOF|nr:hypothetical protein ZIOFF_040435 [Zingiber officinale]
MDEQIERARLGRRRSWRRRGGGVRLRFHCRSSSFLIRLLRVKLCALCFLVRRCLRAAKRVFDVPGDSRWRGGAGGRRGLVSGGACRRSNSFHADAMIKDCLEFIKMSSSLAAEQEAAPATTV